MECDSIDELFEVLNDPSSEIAEVSFIRDALLLIVKEMKTLEADYMGLENYCTDLETEIQVRFDSLQEQINELD